MATELGISRRMAAYYKKQARVPRTVALACRYLDRMHDTAAEMTGDSTARARPAAALVPAARPPEADRGR